MSSAPAAPPKRPARTARSAATTQTPRAPAVLPERAPALHRGHAPAQDRPERPLVSLLISMRNEEQHIARCLESILRQDYPADRLEVLVMDGRSTDRSREIVARLFEGRPHCRLLDNPGVIQSLGWNLGIAGSSGAVIGIVSAHCVLGPGYVSAAVETLRRTGAELVGGPMHAASSGRVGSATALATSSPFGVGGARFHYAQREQQVDTVYQGLCWRSTYERIGGFDPEMVRNQDDELSYRLLDAGGRIICNPAIESRYANRATFRSLARQYFQYGFWKVRLMQKHPRQMRPRHFVPATFVAAVAALGLGSVGLPAARPLFWLVLAAYAAASGTASALAARRGGWAHLPLMPVAFALLHLSYGAGFWKGLLCVRPRRATAPSASAIVGPGRP
jgi:succinoglycan biosynthesis protein ExoA